MKIRQINAHFSWYGKTILFVMRAFIGLFCMVAFGFSSKHGLSQTTVVIDADTTMTVYQVFGLIKKQTGSTFLYDYDMFKDSPAIRLKKGTVKTGTLLDKIRNTGNFKYEYTADKTVIFSKIKDSPSSQPDNRPVIRQLRVTGTVTDPTGSPLPGVNIVVKDARHGTMSDEDGNYSILVNATDVLTFSFVGFKKVELAVDGREVIDVQMEEDVMSLEGVEVNAGYYKVLERNRTGSISRVMAEEIQDQPVTSPLMALQGRVPGLEISPSGGTPGIAPKIRIRGENSLRVQKVGVTSIPGLEGGEGGRPLYVVDGVPVASGEIVSVGNGSSGDYFEGSYDPLAAINPENISSIEVLKDADATAIYGSRGANGVILITTKQGRGMIKESTDVQLSFYRGIGKYSGRADLLNTEQYLMMRHEGLVNDGIDLESASPRIKGLLYPDLTFWDQNRYTNWQKVLMGGTADITDIQGNLSGGNGATSYRVGGAYHRESLITPGDSHFSRATGHMSVNHISKNNRFRANVSVNYGITKHDVAGGSMVSQAMTLPPNAPELYDENGELNWEVHPDLERESWTNPLASAEVNTTSDNRNLVANANLNYQLFTGLEAKVNLGYTEFNGKEIRRVPITSMAPRLRYNPQTGSGNRPNAQFNDNHRESIVIEPQLNYQRRWGNHSLEALVGATYQQSNDARKWLRGLEYTNDAFLGSLIGAGVVNVLVDQEDEYRYAGGYGRIGYMYQNRYILNVSGRRDGSSRFGPGKRFGNFGAVGAAWIFSDEPWLKEHFSLLSFGKLRGSYGSTGNDQVGNYRYLDLYQLNSISYQDQRGLLPYALFNPNYSWERTKKLEGALELGILDNRLSLQVAWYRNRSTNQLISRVLPYTTGFNSVIDNFSEAVIENSGWEFLIRGEPFRSKNFQWDISFNLSVNRNKLVSFPGIEDSPYNTVFKVGESLSIQRLYTWLGVDAETGEHQFLDVNEDGIINDDDRQFNNALDRDFYGGINQNLRYKGFQLSFLFQFSRQNARYLDQMPGRMFNQPELVLRRWQQPGDVTDIQRFSAGSLGSDYTFLFRQSNADIADASFLRLKTLNVSYRFSDQILKYIGVKQLRLFIQGQNLFTITGYEGPDPETGYGAPPIRMLTSGIQVTF